LSLGLRGQGIIENFYRRLHVDKLGAFNEKILFPSPAPHSLGNLVFRKVDQERIAVSVAVLINDLAVA
jgi:hypothetical protein